MPHLGPTLRAVAGNIGGIVGPSQGTTGAAMNSWSQGSPRSTSPVFEGLAKKLLLGDDHFFTGHQDRPGERERYKLYKIQ
jgi:hypothetical protein